jgi:hypothetical protein
MVMKVIPSELVPGDRLDFGRFQNVQIVSKIEVLTIFGEPEYRITFESGKVNQCTKGYKFTIAAPEPPVQIPDKVSVDYPTRFQSALGDLSSADEDGKYRGTL